MGVSWQCDRVRPSMSQIPNVESSFAAAVSSHPCWAPTKTVRIIREQEDEASFCHVLSPRDGRVTSIGAMVADRVELAND
jgi:hypothetical protein